jgi:dTDP-4-dehydrorhamnose reductase
MKKILILGASGMLGSMVLDFLSTKKDLKVTGTLRSKEVLIKYKTKYKNVKFTLTSLDDVLSDKISFSGFDYIINCIGIIKQKSADPKEMIFVNSLLPYSISEKAPRARIIQIATDCVFSGINGRYSEKDVHDAYDIYGKTKSLGEVNEKNFFNIRTSIVGPDQRFKVSLLEWFLSQKKNAVISGYTNHYWNGVTTLHFAKLFYALISKNRRIPSDLHFVPADSLHKYQLLKIFSKWFNREDILIKKFKDKIGINRTLSTIHTKINVDLWNDMGYNHPLSIDSMVYELKEYIKERNFYA